MPCRHRKRRAFSSPTGGTWNLKKICQSVRPFAHVTWQLKRRSHDNYKSRGGGGGPFRQSLFHQKISKFRTWKRTEKNVKVALPRAASKAVNVSHFAAALSASGYFGKKKISKNCWLAAAIKISSANRRKKIPSEIRFRQIFSTHRFTSTGKIHKNETI